MLSSINSVRPYSVNNYLGKQNSAKSQTAFGSATSEIASEVAEQGAKKGAGFFRKVARFLSNAQINLYANGLCMSYAGLLEHFSPSHSLKEKLIFGAAFKAIAEVVDIKISRELKLKYSPARYPLDFSAWIAHGFRDIFKSVEK